jgi:hypothetical protein
MLVGVHTALPVTGCDGKDDSKFWRWSSRELLDLSRSPCFGMRPFEKKRIGGGKVAYTMSWTEGCNKELGGSPLPEVKRK